MARFGSALLSTKQRESNLLGVALWGVFNCDFLLSSSKKGASLVPAVARFGEKFSYHNFTPMFSSRRASNSAPRASQRLPTGCELPRQLTGCRSIPPFCLDSTFAMPSTVQQQQTASQPPAAAAGPNSPAFVLQSTFAMPTKQQAVGGTADPTKLQQAPLATTGSTPSFAFDMDVNLPPTSASTARPSRGPL
jgi:hypothetical protein